MDEAGQASTDRTPFHMSDALKERIMNKLQLIAYPAIAALSIVAAFAAHADSITPDDSTTQVWAHTKTRDQVKAELFQARADGSMKVWSASYNPLLTAPKSEKTRDQVRAEVVAERASQISDYGTRFYGEDSGSFYLSSLPVRRDASHVVAASK
jgi:hypothetical protein